MTNTQKKNAIKRHVKDMLKQAQAQMLKDLDHVLNVGCVSISDWEPINTPMTIPKAIICALLEKESTQFAPAKFMTTYRQWNKDRKNILYFI